MSDGLESWHFGLFPPKFHLPYGLEHFRSLNADILYPLRLNIALVQRGCYVAPTKCKISLQVSSGVFAFVYTVNFASS